MGRGLIGLGERVEAEDELLDVLSLSELELELEVSESSEEESEDESELESESEAISASASEDRVWEARRCSKTPRPRF